ncbi:tRNA preQ1(34) S-adenosylmethionine ribosyltransferase-isomerase QueA [Sneathiella chungangensis]|uniref:S-adenosylmethionine:tRNA ribosyltransferase-isomerase n=1 Tax=Sneathiella chungangensis TaxID=1418234 RepID=A0A845MBQ1_9PROT|nr:tRNA preQ1(34) S-adenosylmethionine ribosyltransferase-isomerase QueA [Sneathiella chungangensis]MZR21265.1 tRNA preQ1(34) S-adenosylmethionine ribosyltransferase-isomerase QueA [Sneathiella chungangensis]
MKVDLFDFTLPPDRIADRPAVPREAAKLLVVGKSLADHKVADLPGLLREGDLLVFNDTKVIPARLRGTRRTAKIEVTLHKNVAADSWHAFAKPAKKLKVSDIIRFSDDFTALVTEKFDGGEVALSFSASGPELMEKLMAHGEIPLPPYISSLRPVDEQDKRDYQTIFAKDEGAVAAPTAGLHFTKALLEKFRARGIEMVTTTLHVGAGTFLPVKVEDTEDHLMHAERGFLNAETARKINEVRTRGGRIVSVGTTSLRLLESAADEQGILHPFEGETDIFITPGYRFKAIDLLITNFHLPKSTLFMLVSAFSGLETMKAAYAHAIAEKYRFYSYGDCSLLYPTS